MYIYRSEAVFKYLAYGHLEAVVPGLIPVQAILDFLVYTECNKITHVLSCNCVRESDGNGTSNFVPPAVFATKIKKIIILNGNHYSLRKILFITPLM